MAEQFENIYISAREFVSSWEKEIYELNNLDYFIFLLINDLATTIERDFFSKENKNELLFLHSEEIGMLSFNIGDSLQLFFEKNCFGACMLKCPVKLNEKLEGTEQSNRYGLLSKLYMFYDTCHNKEQCFYSDVLNYVVLDSLQDFYNYEIGIDLNEANAQLIQFADFIMNIILNFTRNEGQHLLSAPNDSAFMLFNKLIQSDESIWEDIFPEVDDDLEGDEDTEIWKVSSSSVESIVEEFKENYKLNFDPIHELSVVDKLKEYLVDFLEIKKIEDVSAEDIEEFFTVILINDLILEDRPQFQTIKNIYSNFFNYLEFNHDVSLKDTFNQFMNNHWNEVVRTFELSRNYQQRYPLVDFLMTSTINDETLVEGFFEIIDRNNNNFLLEDIHMKSKFKPVDLSRLPIHSLKAGDILHLQLVMEGLGWRMVHLEMIYPAHAKYYLY